MTDTTDATGAQGAVGPQAPDASGTAHAAHAPATADAAHVADTPDTPHAPDAPDAADRGTPEDRLPRACCAPSRPDSRPDSARRRPAAAARAGGVPGPLGGWRPLSGGTFPMGCEDGPYPADGEGPVREVTLPPLLLAATAVTAEEFAAFVAATGHRTDAERFGWSFVFGGFLPHGFPPTRAAAAAPWWRQVHGADWRHPEGPQSDLEGREDHPVVHVSHNDALAYCSWAGARLPSEAEWEYGARGGLSGMPYPWGEERDPGGVPRMNIWRGSFPDRNTAADGYAGTCPVDAFPPNGYGLFNMTGNVWEWCAGAFADGCDARALRGGSHLCHESYCLRYRTSARMGNTPDSSSGNTGFRLAL